MGKILNKAQAQEIFDKASVLIGCIDAVSLYIVEQIFGEDAASFASRPGETSNMFGIGDYSLPYLNHKGFMLAASFCNVKNIRSELNAQKGKVV